ncbi:MAG: serine/threonine-protein phosphatase [Oscillospiraceae bacterium]|nr:serine/threonine-protein phosphatase [Oscillospiraceae bacterium]
MRFFKKKSIVPSGVVSVGHVHNIGARDSQQDAFGFSGSDCGEGGTLAIVADGMGGLVNSGQISTGIVSAVMDAYAPGGELPAATHLQLLLKRAIGEAAALTAGLNYQSGSTLVAGLVQNNGLSWISVGDSRIYLWRAGGLIQLNRDHDFAHDLMVMAIMDQITFEEADSNPRKGSLTSYIGRDFPRYVDFNPEPITLRRGDRIILMSDGIYRALTEAELTRYLRRPAAKCARIMERRIRQKKLPQQDNFTAVILEIE